MSRILDILFKALNKMPPSISPADNADILLTLLFWKLMSAWSCGTASRRASRHHLPETALARITSRNLISFNHLNQYDACRWSKPQDALSALHESLMNWINAQPFPGLMHVVRPQRFAANGPYAHYFKHTAVLAEVMTLIGNINPQQDAPGLMIGEIFRQALHTLPGLMPDHQPLSTQSAQLLADLTQPLAVDTLYDPTCGTGQLLLTCLDTVAGPIPNHRLVLLGHEPDRRMFALASMRLLSEGISLFHIEQASALNRTSYSEARLTWEGADVVMLRLAAQHEDWDNLPAPPTILQGTPIEVPQDMRLALIWHGLNYLKKETSRMAVVLPLSLLASSDGLALRRYLVQQKHLAAIIELPGLAQQGQIMSVLMVRHHHASNQVAFINATPAGPGDIAASRHYDHEAILAAYQSSQSGKAAPWLRMIDDATLAEQEYSFHLAAYVNRLRETARLDGRV
ncbi:MAG: hypothetical protein RL748_2411 [Pseudomonadota bacterium]